MYEGEAENRAELVRHFLADFARSQLAEAVLCEALNRAQLVAVIPNLHLRVVVCGLTAAAVRRHRATVSLCEIGLLTEATIMTRSLFETLLAERFVLKRPKSRKHCSPELQSVLGKVPKIPDRYEAKVFRAILYQVTWLIHQHRHVGKVITQRGSRRVIPKQALTRRAADVADMIKTIGPKWEQTILKHPKTYSGLNVAQMAEVYGMVRYYNLYHSLSATAHGSDATRNVRVEQATILLIDDADRLPNTLTSAALLVHQFADDLNRAFKLGLDSRLEEVRTAYAAELHRARAEKRAKKK